MWLRVLKCGEELNYLVLDFKLRLPHLAEPRDGPSSILMRCALRCIDLKSVSMRVIFGEVEQLTHPEGVQEYIFFFHQLGVTVVVLIAISFSRELGRGVIGSERDFPR